MAILFLESFDGYGGTAAHASKWSTLAFGTAGPVPRTGAYRMNGNSNTRAIAPGSNTLIIGFAFYWGGTAGSNLVIGQDAGVSQTQTNLELGADGKVRIRAFIGSTIIGESATAVLVSGSWNFIEAKIFVSNSGTFTVKVNGAAVLTGSGDTQTNGSSAIGGVKFDVGSNNGIDDLFVLDSTGSVNNDLIGDHKVECLTVQTGNGANVGLTPSTGTDHGALVDELPANDDTDYNFSAAAGAKDTYAFTNLASTGVVRGVQISIRAKKTDSAAKELAIVTRLGSTDYDGATTPVASTTYGQYQRMMDTRPSDGGAWTIADVNGAEFGMKVVS